jgi:hypothetical protein
MISPTCWEAQSALVLSELRRLDTQRCGDRARVESQHSEVMRAIAGLQVDVATLRVKAGLWGLVAGTIPVLVAAVVAWLRQAGP